MTLPVLRSSNQVGRWDSWPDFTGLHRQLNDLVQSVFEPLADLTENEDNYLVEVELPGVKREDISIEVSGTDLSISGEFKEKERTGWLRSRTRRTGRFSYRVSLPQTVDADKVTAALADGVLTVTIPKAESSKPRRIEITGR